MNNYYIHPDYVSRKEILFLNTENRTDEYQNEVYKFARNVAIKCNHLTIADIGTGSGYKLVKYFNEFYTYGYDLPETISKLKAKYPKKNWVVSDFTAKPKIADLVICADVIEHILNPNELIAYIKAMKPLHIVISTPCRDILEKKLKRSPIGPPENPYHIREWSEKEFKDYISQHFNIIEHFVVANEYCQVVYCELKK